MRPRCADNIAAAALGGRIVQVGRLGGRRDTIDLDELARKRIALVGVTFRTRTAAERVAVVQRAWAATGRRRRRRCGRAGRARRVSRSTTSTAAHAALAADGHVGKLVIVP